MHPNWQHMQGGFIAQQQAMYGNVVDPNYHQQMNFWYQQQWAPAPAAGGQNMPGGLPNPPLPDDGSKPPLPANPAPPSDDEKPPLPPEPPPEEPKQEEMAPKSQEEQVKLDQLQQQAAQWQQQVQQPWGQQWGMHPVLQGTIPQGLQPHGPQSQGPQPLGPQSQGPQSQGSQPHGLPDPATKQMYDAIIQEEKDFDVQYKQWKQQYEDWKKQNENHPNKEQFHQYEQQWQTYEQQMEEKQSDILRRKQEIHQKMASAPQQMVPPIPGQGLPPYNQPPNQQGQMRPNVPGQAQMRPNVPGQAQMRPNIPGQGHMRSDAPSQGQIRPNIQGHDQIRPDGPNKNQGRQDVIGQNQMKPGVPGQSQIRAGGPGPGQIRPGGPRQMRPGAPGQGAMNRMRGQGQEYLRGQRPQFNPRGQGPNNSFRQNFNSQNPEEFYENDGYEEHIGGDDMELEDENGEGGNRFGGRNANMQRFGAQGMNRHQHEQDINKPIPNNPFRRPGMGRGQNMGGPKPLMSLSFDEEQDQRYENESFGEENEYSEDHGQNQKFGQGPRFTQRGPMGDQRPRFGMRGGQLQGSRFGFPGNQQGMRFPNRMPGPAANKDYEQNKGDGSLQQSWLQKHLQGPSSTHQNSLPGSKGQQGPQNRGGPQSGGKSPYQWVKNQSSAEQEEKKAEPSTDTENVAKEIADLQKQQELLNELGKLEKKPGGDSGKDSDTAASSGQEADSKDKSATVDKTGADGEKDQMSESHKTDANDTDEKSTKPPTPTTQSCGPPSDQFQGGPNNIGIRPPGPGPQHIRQPGPGARPPGPGPQGGRPQGPGARPPGPGQQGGRPQGPAARGPIPNQRGPRQDGPRFMGPNQQGLRQTGPNQQRPPGPNQQGFRPTGPNQQNRFHGPNQQGLRGHRPTGPNQQGMRSQNPNQFGPRSGPHQGPRHLGPNNQRQGFHEFGHQEQESEEMGQNFGDEYFDDGQSGYESNQYDQQWGGGHFRGRGRGGDRGRGRGRGGRPNYHTGEQEYAPDDHYQQDRAGQEQEGYGQEEEGLEAEGERYMDAVREADHPDRRIDRAPGDFRHPDPYRDPYHEGRFGRRSPPPHDPYARVPPHDPYGRPPLDPYYDRHDPYDRYDPYHRRDDPYGRPLPPPDPYDYDRRSYYDPYRAPYDYGRDYRYPERPLPPPVEERPFQKPEVIDHGHKSTEFSRESVTTYQAPQVIDYGHGKQDERESDRPYTSIDRDRERFRDTPGYGSPGRDSLGRGPVHEPKVETIKVDDLLVPPGRKSRPSQIVVILRGLPGAGKTYVGKLIKDKEVQHGGGAPRMLCLDDYFMTEVEKSERDPETGKKVKKKVLEYEYEAELEDSYRQNMFKSFKKTIDDGFFPFIIVDAVNDKVKQFEEFWSYAKSKGFQVYIAEIDADVQTCSKRNIHKRTLKDIDKIQKNWQETPRHYLRLDIRSLLQEDSINEVEMEDEDVSKSPEKRKAMEDDEEGDEDMDLKRFGGVHKKSKWELEASEKELDKLDGLVHNKRKRTPSPISIDDYLRDEMSRPMVPGQKRVRWADLEERNAQYRMREIGFVVGQTQRDWERITDDSFADRQLNRTKYF